MSVWRSQRTLILASGSQTRLDLLLNAGLTPLVKKSNVDEREIEQRCEHLAPADLALQLSTAKAENVAENDQDAVVIGADQILEVEGTILHKPTSAEEAYLHLERLQGRIHRLHSAVTATVARTSWRLCQTAQLAMRPLQYADIEAYVALAGEKRVMSSVGGYQLEGLGIHLFERINGDHSTILGLPMIPLLAKFREMGFLAIT